MREKKPWNKTNSTVNLEKYFFFKKRWVNYIINDFNWDFLETSMNWKLSLDAFQA